MSEVIDVFPQLIEERDEVVVLIEYIEMRDHKEKSGCRLPVVVCQSRNDFVHRAKYELEHMMLVLKQINGIFRAETRVVDCFEKWGGAEISQEVRHMTFRDRN
jgi:hypothetical protein